MRILALESSAKAASVAVCEDSRLISQYFQNSGLTHSRTLLKMAEDMLANLELKLGDMELIAVASGPGSFTGIRIGVSAAKGLAWGADLPLCGISTLEAMAYQLADQNAVICPVMDARRAEVYNAKFVFNQDKLQRLCADRAIPAAELIREAKEDPAQYCLVGDGAELCSKLFAEAGVPCLMAPVPIRLQTAWGVAMAAYAKADASGGQFSSEELIPNYLRVSQAERERRERLNK
jgi:tRNA threonylcarbamoyladenosine biosynthesis protein TsaB